MAWKGRPARKRARDGHQFSSASKRRGVRKRSGLSARSQKRGVKARRAYKSGKRGWAKQRFW